MGKYGIFILFLYCTCLSAQTYNKEDIAVYIQTYSAVAVKKMQEHHIPASITLAQGILESGAGKSELAQNAFNHFGIKCHSTWIGATYHKDDDAKNECFRKYKSATESFEDHSQFLKASRYAELFILEPTDYQGWAYGLKKAGYATHPQYAQRLIRIIEEYNLAIYDKTDYPIASDESKKEPLSPKKEREKAPQQLLKPQSVPNQQVQQKEPSSEFAVKENYNGFSPVYYPYTLRAVYSNNGSYFVVAKQGDTFFRIATEVQLSVGKLKSFNEVPNNRYEPYRGEMIYLQRKKPYAEKTHHVLKSNETIRSLAQQYGCRMSSIYNLNKLDNPEVVITEGMILKLRK
jgi:LysM repeat protein